MVRKTAVEVGGGVPGYDVGAVGSVPRPDTRARHQLGCQKLTIELPIAVFTSGSLKTCRLLRLTTVQEQLIKFLLRLEHGCELNPFRL